MLLGVLCPLESCTLLTPLVTGDQLARPCIRPNNPVLLAILKCSKWHIPVKEQNISALSYLSFILISMSADVELNPGPADYPCGNCAIEDLDNDADIVCDECGLWFHI